MAQAPGAPSGLSVSVTGLRADLTWTAGSGTPTYVQIERRISPASFQAIRILVPGAVRWYDDSVWPSRTYDYQVKACNTSGCSTASNSASGVIGAAPTATGSLSVPATAFIDEAFIVDARASTNICRRPQANGTPSLTITVDGDTDFKVHIPAFGYAARSAGVKTIRLNGKNCSGVAITEVTAAITISAIPAATGGGIQNLTDSGNAATNATNVQNAVNTAGTQDSVEQEVRLNGCWSTEINGPITLKGSGSKYKTLVWTGLTVPTNKRVAPADMACAPTINQNNTANLSNDVNGGIEAALQTPTNAPDPPIHHWRVQGIHVKKRDVDKFAPALIQIGMDAGFQTTYAKIVHHFIFNHIWIDGGTGAVDYAKDGIRSYGDYISMFDSYASELKRPTGADPSAVSISGGVGPTYWMNNYLVADGENFSVNSVAPQRTATISSASTTGMTLSAVTDLQVDDNIAVPVGGEYHVDYTAIVGSIAGNVITFKYPLIAAPDNAGTAQWQRANSFLTYRRNYAFKPLSWGNSYMVKNLWETKNNKYVVIDAGVFENGWGDQQPFNIVIGSDTPDPELAGHVIREFQFSNNVIKNANSGMQILGGQNNAGEKSQQYSDFHIYNNIFRVGWDWIHTGAAAQYHTFVMARGGPAVPHRVFFIHNTDDAKVITDNGFDISTFGDQSCGDFKNGISGFDTMWYNSLHQDKGFGYFSQCGSLDLSVSIKHYLPPGDTTSWNKNEIVNTNGHTYPASAITQATVAWNTGIFQDWANGDLRLKVTDPGHNTALDGTDIGADINVIKTAIGASSTAFDTATIKVVTGDWTGTVKCNWNASTRCQ